jgi:predicted nucleic acid-binding protein
MEHPTVKRIYLDVCALSRPFDDQHQVRIQLETHAVALILEAVKQNKCQLIVSLVHHLEIAPISDLEERRQLTLLLEQLGTRYPFDLSKTKQRTQQLIANGLKLADATHFAFAEQAQADFVTVDDRLLKQCGRVQTSIWYGTPLAYCEKENLR